jgi:GT2 family glycosyltransferase/glycosyltransferase involved in cell wall biosynthesis
MRILLIVHGYPPLASAGTEVYVRSLARALAVDGRDDLFVLTRDNDASRPEYHVRYATDDAVKVVRINNTFQSCRSFADSYLNPDFLRVAMKEVGALRPDVAHIHHLTCLSTGLPEALAARGCPVVMTLNDYWMMCHRGQLFDLDNARCAGPFDGGCGRCVPPAALAAPAAFRAVRLARSLPIPGMRLLERIGAAAFESATPVERARSATVARLTDMRDAARHVDLFLAPSATMAGMCERFGIERARLRQCDQGIDLEPFQATRREPSSSVRLGYAGGLLPSKAPHLLLEAAATLPAGSVTVDVLGSGGSFHGDDRYARRLTPLLAHPFVRRVGAVPHERMADALAAVDVVVVPSVWIENAPFIIREAFASGAPVIASNLGGMREMIVHERDGLLFEPGSPAALAVAIRRLVTEPDLLPHLRGGIRPPASIRQDAGTLRQMYATLTAHPRRASTVRPFGTAGRRGANPEGTAAVVLNFRTPDQTWLAVRSLQASDHPPGEIVIVDNGSQDGSVPYLAGRLPDVTIIEAGANHGYSAGCNVGIAHAMEKGADLIVLVNSDAVLKPDAFTALRAAARDYPDAGVFGALILSREEPDQVASAGLLFSERTARMRHRAAGSRVAQVSPGAHDVPAISGCVMMIRIAVLRRIGLLDEAYFYSFEDLDYCLRARRAGFRVLLVPGAVAYHEGGRTIGRRSSQRVYFATRNHLRLARSTLSGSRLSHAARGALIVGMNAAYAVLSPQVPLVGGLTAVARGARDHVRGRYGGG